MSLMKITMVVGIQSMPIVVTTFITHTTGGHHLLFTHHQVVQSITLSICLLPVIRFI
ncbi:hypothetical protein MBAV_001630 [Candidatus Magnetobacterium bavaricum]|uniref:Uncharacterized protein n=1 Tax=Candidatus Magnetobacterium bavaricum TaxID=29290 RepID=A0A0F3GW96_9BACT|nr:hypothetical protein MBAV_001630 [Candidatus Magnetobacterium bavaricum]